MNHDDLATRIDASFDDGPVAPPVSTVLHAGRARLLRQRLAAGGGALVAAATVAAVAGVTLGGNASRADDRSAGQPSGTPACAVGYDPDAPLVDNWAYLGKDGSVVSVGGARVTEQIENPLGRPAPAMSVAVAMKCGDAVRWYLLDQSAGGPDNYGYSFSSPAGAPAGATLQDWVDRQLTTQQIRDSGPSVVRFAEATGDRPDLVAVDGATIERQRSNPDVGEAGGSSAARTAAAEVTWHGATYFVVAVQAYELGSADYAAVPRDAATPSFSAFVAGLPARYGNQP